jgi:serine phosphatase RsbU (regulator of sigma subunit)
MARVIARHGLSYSRDALTAQALSATEAYLRTRRADDFTGMSLRAFRGTLMVSAAKLAWAPFWLHGQEGRSAPTLPACSAYEGKAVYLPLERVGGYCFGGDWLGGVVAKDGSLWVFLADVTGHGYYAYLLASRLPDIWRTCWDEAGGAGPVELLGVLHDLLGDCMPEGVYTEAILAHLGPDGHATLVPAGACRILVRRRGLTDIACHTLSGSWLGLCRPSADDQRSWSLGIGDELMLATDGLFDQLRWTRRGTTDLATLLAPLHGQAPLLEGVQRALHSALQEHLQVDDITAVALRRSAFSREDFPRPPASLAKES